MRSARSPRSQAIAELNLAVLYDPVDRTDHRKFERAWGREHYYPRVGRADFLARLGRAAEARMELERAAGLTRNESERALLLERAATLGDASGER